MIQKTVMITIWWQNRDDYDMMTVQGWGLTPGRAPATRPPLPPTLSATRPAQIVFLHSCSSVFVTSTNCISSLMLKCNRVQAPSVFLHSWSSAFVPQRKLCFFLIHDEVYLCNSANCIFSLMLKCIFVPAHIVFFSLMLKCIWHQRKLNLFFHDQVHLCDSANCIFYSWWSVFA